MAKIERFEDLEAWQVARHLSQLIYGLTAGATFSKDYALRDQIRRAAVSILSNISEGFERGGDREFRQFLSIAKGSVGELRAQLYVALDAQYITKSQFDQSCALSLSTARLLSGLMRYLGESTYMGNKFKSNDMVSDAMILDLGPETLDRCHG